MPKCKKKSADQRRKEQRQRAAERRNSVPEVREIERALDAEARRSARSIAEVREDERVREVASKRSARCDPEIREIERSRDLESKRVARSDPEVREIERRRDVESKRAARTDPKVRETERSRDVESKRVARSDPKVREIERSRDVESKRAARSDPEVRETERSRDVESKRAARTDPKVRETERSRDVESKRAARTDPKVRETERSRDVQSKRAARSDPKVRALKRISDVESKRTARSDPKVRAVKRISDVESKRTARSDPKVRAVKRISDVELKRAARSDPQVKRNKRIRDAELKRAARLKPEVRAKKRRIDMESKRKSRCIPFIKLIKRAKDSASICVARLDSNKRKHEAELRIIRVNRLRRSHVDKYDTNKKLYFDFIRRAPVFICSCCGQTWYKESTVVVTADDIQHYVEVDDLKKVLWVNQAVHRLCSTCYSYVKRNKIPKLALCNGLDFPELPTELKELTPLESLLISLRVPFMTIQAVGSERQSKLRGNVVNVPNDLDVCALTLPRKFNEASVVQLQFMRRMRYRQPYMFDKIRPYKVYKAMMFLMTTELYKNANVVLSHDWSRHEEDDTIDFISDPESFNYDHDVATVQESRTDACIVNIGIETNVDCSYVSHNTFARAESGNLSEALQSAASQQHLPANDEENEESTSEFTVSNGAEETLIMEDVASIVKIAPAEGLVPIPLTHDEHAEEMSFPTIYCGIPRKFSTGTKLSYTDIAKSELRRYDRRGTIPRKVLYSFKKSYNEKINQAYQICLRKKTGNHHLTAADIRSPEVLSNILQHDEGYGVFNKVRCTPAYWSLKSKQVVSMVRQLGKCSLFVTLSAAETKWLELIVILKQQVDKVIVTEEEAKNIDGHDVARLIRLDPTTCMRHFEHRFDCYFKYLLKGKDGIFAPHEIEDFFFRLEFQARGSPHIHGLIWLKDAPVFAEGVQDTVDQCISFIDRYLTCERKTDDKLAEYMGYQLHKHTHTCYKKSAKKRTCRFGFPRPPLNTTRLLLPLPQDYDKEERDALLNIYESIETRLTEMGRDFKEDICFSTFLKGLGITEQKYLLALQSSIKRPTVFLKRKTTEIFINNYNSKMLEAWGANMDIQFVLDTYACARYCAGYITKPDGGLSKLLQVATKEVRLGNFSIREKLRKFGNVLINGVEISVQEAVAFILGISMMRCSRQVLYINTSPAFERTSMLKNTEELSMLSDDSEDICAKGLIDHYIQRSKDLENICLAYFASNYEFESIRKYSSSQGAESFADNESPLLNQSQSNPRHKLLDNSGYVRLRRVSKIVRFRNYSVKLDPSNFYREQLMLFVPWRNESAELVNINGKSKYESHLTEIKVNSKFVYFRDDISEELIGEAMDTEVECEDDSADNIIDNNLQLLPEERTHEYVDELTTVSPKVLHFLPPKLVDCETYVGLMRSLNDRQRRVVLHVTNEVKSSVSPCHIFLHGGAGVGKSHTINAIVQNMLRWQATDATLNPEHPCVIVAAPTGKAAFNVFGMTLHCAFKLPPNQSRILVDLNDSTLNTLRANFSNVKLIIIDEISMVSSKTLYQVDQRLRQIFANSNPFGGISILVNGRSHL